MSSSIVVVVVRRRRLCQLIPMCSTSPSRYLRIAEQWRLFNGQREDNGGGVWGGFPPLHGLRGLWRIYFLFRCLCYGKSVGRGAFPPFFDLMAPNNRYQLKLFVWRTYDTIIDLAKPLSACAYIIMHNMLQILMDKKSFLRFCCNSSNLNNFAVILIIIYKPIFDSLSHGCSDWIAPKPLA